MRFPARAHLVSFNFPNSRFDDSCQEAAEPKHTAPARCGNSYSPGAFMSAVRGEAELLAARLSQIDRKRPFICGETALPLVNDQLVSGDDQKESNVRASKMANV